MRWDRSYESSNIEDRRAQGGYGIGGGNAGLAFGLIRLLSVFGWKGMLVGLVLAAAVAGAGTCVGGDRLVGQTDRQVASSPQEDELARFVGFVFDDVQKTWSERFDDYATAKLVLFRGGTRSACGTASTAVGPFYCPLDRKVYIDLSFYDELRRRFGAPGDFAQAYVIAHEVGHHVNITGRLGKGEVHQIETGCRPAASPAWAQAPKRQLSGRRHRRGAQRRGTDRRRRSAQDARSRAAGTWTHGSAALLCRRLQEGLPRRHRRLPLRRDRRQRRIR
jgi:predicted metalloprotease